MAKAWCIWSPKAICNWNPSSCWKIKLKKDVTTKCTSMRSGVSFFRSGGCKCVRKQNIFFFFPIHLARLKLNIFFFFFGSIRNDTTLLTAILFPQTLPPEKCPRHASMSEHIKRKKKKKKTAKNPEAPHVILNRKEWKDFQDDFWPHDPSMQHTVASYRHQQALFFSEEK